MLNTMAWSTLLEDVGGKRGVELARPLELHEEGNSHFTAIYTILTVPFC